MKTLKQLLKDWHPDEAEAFKIKAKEWLEQKRLPPCHEHNLVGYAVSTRNIMLDELLEELKQ